MQQCIVGDVLTPSLSTHSSLQAQGAEKQGGQQEPWPAQPALLVSAALPPLRLHAELAVHAQQQARARLLVRLCSQQYVPRPERATCARACRVCACGCCRCQLHCMWRRNFHGPPGHVWCMLCMVSHPGCEVQCFLHNGSSGAARSTEFPGCTARRCRQGFAYQVDACRNGAPDKVSGPSPLPAARPAMRSQTLRTAPATSAGLAHTRTQLASWNARWGTGGPPVCAATARHGSAITAGMLLLVHPPYAVQTVTLPDKPQPTVVWQ